MVSFAAALEALLAGKRVQRAGWPWPTCWVVYVPATYTLAANTMLRAGTVDHLTALWIGNDTPQRTLPHLALYGPEGVWQPGWTPTTADLLSGDWVVAGPPGPEEAPQ